MKFNYTIFGDCRDTLRSLPEATFQCCVTSPPYWLLRDYGHSAQIGQETTSDAYVDALVGVFSLVRRVLLDDGTLWLNIGDSYSASAGGGLKPKDLCGIPWRLALALQADGWWLRSDIIWAKPNPMPESVLDRPTKAHEYVFLLAKSETYFFDAKSIKEPAICAGRVLDYTGDQKANYADPILQRTLPRGRKRTVGDMRNARTVWTVPSHGYNGAHFATMPPRLAERCILAGSSVGSAVLDPFIGSGTTGMVAETLGRRWLGCELNKEYASMIAERTVQMGLPWSDSVNQKDSIFNGVEAVNSEANKDGGLELTEKDG
jgi:DNA modification methylase